MSSTASAPTVLLVGRKLADAENLGLACLLGALRDAGIPGELGVLNGPDDLPALARRALAGDVPLVGLALPDGNTSFLPLALGELLDARGYPGHVTCGGAFATLAREWLLERYPWLGSVVRFAGERPLVALARALARGESLDDVPGLTTRAGDGRPAPVTDPLPLRVRAVRGELPEILGMRAAHVSSARGCPGRCLYCGPAALQTLERAEGLRAGCGAAELRAAGVGGTRRRDDDELCDELAGLWHDRGVRYFYFVDEHLLPADRDAALGQLDRWRRGLARRRVGRFGFGMMSRADLLHPDVVRSAADLGLVRCFVGVELASREELRRFGRTSGVAEGTDAIARLAEQGIATVANLMLLHPDSTPATIAGGLEFLAGMRGGVFEATQMMPYHGTRLQQRLAREGRLVGNPLRWGYSFPDPVVARFGEVFARLRGESFGNYSLAFRVHDLALALALARRLRPELPAADLAARCGALAAEANRLRVEALRRGLELARAGGGFDDAAGLVAATAAEVARLCDDVDAPAGMLQARLQRPGRIFSPMRTAAATALVFCLAAADAGCSSGTASRGPESRPAETTAAGDVAVEPSPPQAAGDVAVEPSPPQAAVEPPPVAAAPDDDAGPAEDPVPVGTEPADDCSGRTADQAELAARARLDALDLGREGCPSLEVRFWSEGPPSVSRGWDGSVGPCEDSDDGRADRVRQAFADGDWSCLAGREIERQGREGPEYAEMASRIEERCGGYASPVHSGNVVIVVGDGGTVADVRPARGRPGGRDDETLRCIRRALQGLAFPCLAGRRVCPDWVIVE
ncbi:MAG: radical SAM protein [Deltaproteobacteria bacterium]|nr:radical SAM protein [Deltaproteobacteria bacterium]